MSAAALLDQHIVPNLFYPTYYYRLNVRTGVMQNAFGTKCCTFSGYALQGLYTAPKDETGPAWHLVMRRCGEL